MDTFLLQCKSWVIAKETIWPTKPKMFTVWLVENVYQFQFRETWWDFTLVRQFYWELHHFHFSLLCMGEGNGNPLQCSCLESPSDGGAWWATVHGVTESQTRLSDFTFTFPSYALEKEMATHSSVLALRIPGTGESGGLPSMGSQSRTWLKRLSSSSSRPC